MKGGVPLEQARNIVGFITGKLAYIAMAVTFIIMCVTTADVIIRKVSTGNIVGSYEMTEMGLVLIVAFAAPFLQVAKGHVRVDIFVNRFPIIPRHIVDGLLLLVSGIVMAIMVYAIFIQAGTYLATNAGTSVIRIPYAPFMYAMGVGYCLYAILLFIDGILEILNIFKRDKDEDGIETVYGV
jgi:TRAP-type C4-dicarboxylate transport system permease small subunit